jgi:hypothetical protein
VAAKNSSAQIIQRLLPIFPRASVISGYRPTQTPIFG